MCAVSIAIYAGHAKQLEAFAQPTAGQGLSINYVTLNFVAVRTGVDFEEVAGTV